MKKNSLIDSYLRLYAAGEKWDLIANDTENVSQVVVIPAYAEKEMLFSTLASIAKNSSSSLEYSFILCVINNKDNSPSAAIKNNLETINYLEALVKKNSLRRFKNDQELYSLLQTLSDSKLKLGYINASSRGYEIPQNTGGVGMARKIGMDMALRLLKNNSAARNLIISLMLIL
jgi:glycosyltransferase involved in cell wall biosynthesis